MAGIGDDGDLDVFVGHVVEPFDGSAKMVFDVSGSFFVRFQLGVELAEQLLQRHSGHVAEDVETTPMRHTHDD